RIHTRGPFVNMRGWTPASTRGLHGQNTAHEGFGGVRASPGLALRREADARIRTGDPFITRDNQRDDTGSRPAVTAFAQPDVSVLCPLYASAASWMTSDISAAISSTVLSDV